MTITLQDAYLAECNGMRRLAYLPRPKVAFAPEMIGGVFCLWRTNGTGSHTDNIRLDPTDRTPISGILAAARSSPLRVRGGNVLVRAPDSSLCETDVALLDRLSASPRSTGHHMARSLIRLQEEPPPRIRDCGAVQVRAPETDAEYLAMRHLTADIFGGGAAAYDPETDFYNAPGTLTYLGAFERGQAVASASVLIVDGIANIWSVCIRESARGRGVASAVTHACLIEAQRQGAHAAVLGTGPDLARTGGMYHRLGFTAVGHEYSWLLASFDRLDLAS